MAPNFRGFPSFELAAAVHVHVQRTDEWQAFAGKTANSEPRGPVYVSKEEVAVGDGLKKAKGCSYVVALCPVAAGKPKPGGASSYRVRESGPLVSSLVSFVSFIVLEVHIKTEM